MTRFTNLLDGYRKFRETGWAQQRDRWSELAEGQSPRVMILACSDSRVEPAIIFDASPGEMFVVRNVANLAPPFETTGGYHGVSAALEFAVTQLEVDEVVVMGHGSCGGCAAALTRQFDGAVSGEGHFIANWVSMLAPARAKVCAEHAVLDRNAYLAMELEGIKISLANLRTFPFVAAREKAGKLSLHGCHFSIAEGLLHIWDEAEDTFRPV